MGIVVFGAVFVDIRGYPPAKQIPGGRNAGRVIQAHGGQRFTEIHRILAETRPG